VYGSTASARDDMPIGNRRRNLKQPLETLNAVVRQSGPAAMASYSLIGAILVFGGLGYAFDAWAESAPWGLLAGLALGLVVGFYQLAMMVWRR
jgi:F0F1-type ATP synthase assembly protein I